MAGDTVEPLYSHQLASVLVAPNFIFLSISWCSFYIGSCVSSCEVLHKKLGVSFAEIWHTSRHVGTYRALSAQCFVQGCLS